MIEGWFVSRGYLSSAKLKSAMSQLCHHREPQFSATPVLVACQTFNVQVYFARLQLAGFVLQARCIIQVCEKPLQVLLLSEHSAQLLSTGGATDGTCQATEFSFNVETCHATCIVPSPVCCRTADALLLFDSGHSHFRH